MSWIAEIEENEAEGELATLYSELREKRGKVSNILKVHSLRPDSMQHHLDLYLGIMFGKGNLGRRQRELIAVAVSQANLCDYCVSHHMEALVRYERDPEALAALHASVADAPLTLADRAIIDYALKLTRAPYAVQESDIQRLRDTGLDDADILHVNLVAAYFNFVNRIALGLGVPHSDDEVKGYRV